jgi:hypothetical protein
MLPLASASGPAYIGAVVISAALFLWWLLRAEAREGAAEKAEEEAAAREAGDEAAHDRLNAP